VSAAVCGLALAAVAAVAGPVAGTGNFNLTGTTTQDVWAGPATNQVGCSVTCTAGEARVFSGGTNFGHVPDGATFLVEGGYAPITVGVASGATNAVGSWSNRSPIGVSDTSADRRIGLGSVTFPLANGGTSYTFYYRPQGAKPRLATFQAGTSAVALTDGSNALVNVEPGDWTFGSRTTTRFGASGGGTSNFVVYDMPPGPQPPTWGPYSGTATAQTAGDVDSVSVDGTVNLSITITNNGPGTVTVSSSGGTAPTSPLAPGASTTCTGNLTSFSWSCQQVGAQVTISVKKP
jgi:hypothetical protein